jgi:glycosyltransferase involved in cell wall biosynthesis
MMEIYKVSALKLITIYNGYDPEFYSYSGNGHPVQNKIVFGFCGRVVPKKNILYCFDLCNAALAKGFEVELVLVLGEAGVIEDPQTYTLINESISSVTFTVRLHHDLSEGAHADLLASCDIGLVPSRGYESIPSVIYEFSAVGVPVFATYDWGIPEIMKQEYALTGDIEEDVLRICSVHGRRLNSLVNDAEYYSYQHIVDEYLQLYERDA